MIGQVSLLVMLVRLVDRLPMASASATRGRGRPTVDADRLFVHAVVSMSVRHRHTVHEVLTVLDHPTPEMQLLRPVVTAPGKVPCRRTWERRLAALPDTLPAQSGCLGRHLVALIPPWATYGRAVAIDRPVLRARGGVWHYKARDAGLVPHTAIDLEAHGTTSGWHGGVYGWNLHIVATVATVWSPVAADLTPANRADSDVAPALLGRMPAEVRVVLGEQPSQTPELEERCGADDRLVVTTRPGRYPHTDAGGEVRRIVHTLRSTAIENFTEQFNGIVDGHGQVPTTGWTTTRRFALGAIFVYQLTWWYRHEHAMDLRVGLKPFLKAA